MGVRAFLDLARISKRYGGVVALRDVDWSVDAGEVHCLVGENGSGKSTLLKIVSGVIAPESGGRITCAGRRFPRLDPVRSKALGIEVIYQDLSLFPNLTVAENVAIDRHLGGVRLVDRRGLERRAAEALGRIGVDLDPRAKVGDLTIASRQLVAIARAMAGDAKLVIMDEPTASLTRREVDALLGLVRDLKARGVAIVFVSHRLDEVLEVAERVTVLRDGAKVGLYDAREVDDARLATLMTGKSFSYERKVGDFSAAPTVLKVSGLTRAGHYEDVSLVVRAGEIVALTGRLGAGRTELALSLFGMNAPDVGVIELDGRPTAFATPRAAIEAGVAYVSEDRLALGLVLEQPIASNVVVTTLPELGGASGLLAPRTVREHVAGWIASLAIKAPAQAAAVGTLSGGNQQRIVLAKWLATKPKLLILDSPTVGVDVSAKDGIYEIVSRLAEAGVAVLMISDEIPEAFHHAHRVLVMREGRIEGELTPASSTERALKELVDA